MRPEGDVACQEQVGIKGPVLLGFSVLAPVDSCFPGLPGCTKQIGLHQAQSWTKNGVQSARPCFLHVSAALPQQLGRASYFGQVIGDL